MWLFLSFMQNPPPPATPLDRASLRAGLAPFYLCLGGCQTITCSQVLSSGVQCGGEGTRVLPQTSQPRAPCPGSAQGSFLLGGLFSEHRPRGDEMRDELGSPIA